MLDTLVALMDGARGHAGYAEARFVARDREDVLVRNGGVDRVDAQAAEGLGVRVRVGGGWGFAATRDVSREGAERALTRALAVAREQPV
ncbi:MAG: hypothetical protein M3P39_00965, partial [Actinomycetota bacterium]|nr:hypothetical protein [Actinomycetota bacterium]